MWLGASGHPQRSTQKPLRPVPIHSMIYYHSWLCGNQALRNLPRLSYGRLGCVQVLNYDNCKGYRGVLREASQFAPTAGSLVLLVSPQGANLRHGCTHQCVCAERSTASTSQGYCRNQAETSRQDTPACRRVRLPQSLSHSHD